MPKGPSEVQAHVLPDAGSMAEAAARQFADACVQAVIERGVFRVALSGGSTPRALYLRLTEPPFRNSIDWGRVFFFWGDERCVAPAHERSNYAMAKEPLLEPLGIKASNIFRIHGEEEPRRAAARYEEVLRTQFESQDATPRFDLVLLGLGSDGHTASLFPGSTALKEKRRLFVANYVAPFREWRLTGTYPLFNAARRVLFLVSGEDKSDPVAKILKKQRPYRQLPAAGIQARSGLVLWLLDRAAGSRL